MSSIHRSPSPQRSRQEPGSNATDKHECKSKQKPVAARRKLSAEAIQRKLEYNRNYMAKKRAHMRTKLREIKKWMLDEPDMIDPLRQMEALKKMVNEKL